MNAIPTLEMLAPATLTVDINVRKDAALTADFIASIKGTRRDGTGNRPPEGGTDPCTS